MNSSTRDRWDGITREPTPEPERAPSQLRTRLSVALIVFEAACILIATWWAVTHNASTPAPTATTAPTPSSYQASQTMFVENTDPDNVESFARILDGEIVLVVLNLSGHEEKVSVSCADGLGTDRTGKAVYAQGGTLDLDLIPFEYMAITFD